MQLPPVNFVWHRGAPALEKRQYTGTPVHRAGILDRPRRLGNEVVRAFLNIVNILLTMGIEVSQGLPDACRWVWAEKRQRREPWTDCGGPLGGTDLAAFSTGS